MEAFFLVSILITFRSNRAKLLAQVNDTPVSNRRTKSIEEGL